MNEEIGNSNNKEKLKLHIKQCYLIVWSVVSKNTKLVRTKNGKTMFLSNWAVRNSKKSKIIYGKLIIYNNL